MSEPARGDEPDASNKTPDLVGTGGSADAGEANPVGLPNTSELALPDDAAHQPERSDTASAESMPPSRDLDDATKPEATSKVGSEGPEGSTSDCGEDYDALFQRSTLRWWWQRPTIRQIAEAQAAHRPYRAAWDKNSNDRTRLPPGEAVHLGGLTLMEAFTPSTVSSLYDRLREWPTASSNPDDDWIVKLERSRSFRGEAWLNLGYVRHPGKMVLPGSGFTDQTLPRGVEAVWLTASFLVPSVAVVSATFTITDDSADLSSLLSDDYETVVEDVVVVAHGAFANWRSRIPWSRPRRPRVRAMHVDPWFGKRRAVKRRIDGLEVACSEWFYDRFSGRFAIADEGMRPSIRLLFTEESIPFTDHHDWLHPAGLDSDLNVFSSAEPAGWRLRLSGHPDDRERPVITVAARRKDVGRNESGSQNAQSNWSLTQQFQQQHAALSARITLHALLSLYSSRLAAVRDAAGKRRRMARPVDDAKSLNRYLLTDGLDSSTFTEDLRESLRHASSPYGYLPTYVSTRRSPASGTTNEPETLTSGMQAQLLESASRLASDTASVTNNIRASAELRQAIANTRLQRIVVIFTIAAVIVALLVAEGGGS